MSDRAYAVLGLFDTPNALMAAIPKVRDAELGQVEAYTPYPIHGIEKALGLRQSPLGGMVMVMGVLGAITAMFFQYWMSAVDYPIIHGGKDPFSWQAFVPIMFEVTVLFATFTAGLGMMLLLNKLPYFGHPVLNAKAIQGITRDRFALAIEVEAGTLDVAAAQRALEAAGARDLEVLPAPETRPQFTSRGVLRFLTGVVAACSVAGFMTYWAIKLFHVLPPMSDMQEQPRLDAQSASAFFKDGSGMRPPVKGTVARGYLGIGVASQEEAASLPNPLAPTPEILAKGKLAYANHCAVCHGASGNGTPTLTAAYGAKPANLLARQFKETQDGQLYYVVVKGKNSMPAYGADLDETQRWAVVHYVRALQRAQDAKDSDLK